MAVEESSAAYLELLHSGELAERAAQARERMKRCDLCAQGCHVNRLESARKTVCRTGARATVSSYTPHHGEEKPIRGRYGSGTIFFTHCNLKCVFCQNWEISRGGEGREMDAGELASVMLHLQARGCHNINLVSPSHVVAPILDAVLAAARQGLHLPLVYNSGGYDSPEGLALLDGVVDIYMPDMKWADAKAGHRLSGAKEYPEVNRAAVREMHRQVGDLAVDEQGVAHRGLLIRHLVMPGGLANSRDIFAFLARDISKNTYLNIMSQYRPWFRSGRFQAGSYAAIDRPPTFQEIEETVATARDLGLNRLDGLTLP